MLQDIIKIDKKVAEIYNYLREMITRKGYWSDVFEFQTLSCASQIQQYITLMNAFSKMSSNVLTKVEDENGKISYKYNKNELIKDLPNLANSLRSNLKEIGLLISTAPIKGEDGLANLISEINDISNNDKE